ncbi:MAG: ATP-binding cassette domain-containing protein, partial [Jatrophihabitantaceae bacterium]
MSTHRARHGADRDGSAYRPTAGPDSVETAGEDAAMDFEVTLEARPTARPVTTPPGSGPPSTTLPRIERLPPQTGALHGRDLHYARAGRTILDGVWMSAQPGQSLAIMGPSGSGKSSLLALLAGLERPDSGEIVRDPPVGRVGLVLQGYGLVSLLTAAENVEVPLQAGAGPTGGGSASKRLTPAQIQQRAGGLLAAVGLAEVADHLTEQLSGGQQQRVAIARALAVEPDVVLAD